MPRTPRIHQVIPVASPRSPQVVVMRTAIACALAAAVLSGGCVQRRLTIRSNPPGALVYIDNYQIGTTPVSTDFIYYGEREIRLVKDGYETLVVRQKIPAPWYQWPPLDFFSENLVPAEIRDERTLAYQMSPRQTVQTQELKARAEQLRQDGLREPYALPIASQAPAPSPGNTLPAPMTTDPLQTPPMGDPPAQAYPPQWFPGTTSQPAPLQPGNLPPASLPPPPAAYPGAAPIVAPPAEPWNSAPPR